jgi:hypothetical protein
MQDLTEQTRLRSLDFDRGLIRLNDQERFALADLLSFLLEPTLDGGLFHIHSQCGHEHIFQQCRIALLPTHLR